MSSQRRSCTGLGRSALVNRPRVDGMSPHANLSDLTAPCLAQPSPAPNENPPDRHDPCPAGVCCKASSWPPPRRRSAQQQRGAPRAEPLPVRGCRAPRARACRRALRGGRPRPCPSRSTGSISTPTGTSASGPIGRFSAVRRRAVPDAAVPPRLPLSAPGDGEHHPRRRADAGPLPAGACSTTGRTRSSGPLPVNLGFAGFRLHYPLNAPEVFDELIAFLGASYFRFLGRGPEIRPLGPRPRRQCRTTASRRSSRISGSSGSRCRGRRRPGDDLRAPRRRLGDRRLPVRRLSFARDDPRRHGDASSRGGRSPSVGIAPLTSMFFEGENDRRRTDDFRPELHDSDGLLMHSGAGEWIWRPLRNPSSKCGLDLHATPIRAASA